MFASVAVFRGGFVAGFAVVALRLIIVAVEQVGDGFDFVPALKAELPKIPGEAIG